MVCSTDPENINIKMDDDALRQVPKFKYLGSILTGNILTGSIFTESGKNKEEIITRIKEAKAICSRNDQHYAPILPLLYLYTGPYMFRQ
jgi:hypothetical protein